MLNRHKDYLPAVYEFALKDPLKPLRKFLILIITANTGMFKPVLIIGKSPKGKRKEYLKNNIETTEPEEKTLRLLYKKNKKTVFLQYRYGIYSLEMSVSHLSDFERLLDWVQIKSVVLESTDDFPDEDEMKAFIDRLKIKVTPTP